MPGFLEPRRTAGKTFAAAIPEACVQGIEPDLRADMAFLQAHRASLHSTKPMERLNGEIKRRTDVFGIRTAQTIGYITRQPATVACLAR